MLGPPDEIASYNMPGAGTLDPTHWHDGLKRGPATDLRPGQRGAVEWLYRSLPQPRAAASQVFTFVRDSTGEYFLSGPLAASFQLDLLEAKGQSEDIAMRKSMLQQALGKGMASSNNDARTHTNLMDAPGSLVNQFDESMRGLEDIRSFGEASIFEQAVPPGSTTSVTTRESFGQILVRDQVHFLQDRDGTRVLIDLGLASRELISSPSPPSTSVELYGRLVSTDDPSRAYQFSTLKDSVAAGAPQDLAGEAGRIFQVSGVLAPGKYSATFGIRVGDKTGAVQERLSVPDFSREGLQMADPILAESIARIESQPAAGEFVLGSLQVLPKLEPVYRTGQPLGFYFQGYGAKQSPTDGRVHLDLVYRFHRREKGLYRPFGTPVRLEDTASPTHAYAFSLNGWESGEYLLTVTLLDTVSQEVVSGSAAFLVH